MQIETNKKIYKNHTNKILIKYWKTNTIKNNMQIITATTSYLHLLNQDSNQDSNQASNQASNIKN